MGQLLLLLVVAVAVAAVVFGVTVLVTGRDPGLVPVEADGRAVPLPGDRPLRESDVGEVRFDTALRGYRMAQVDQALRRAAYDIGYKTELIGVLEAEVTALRDGRTAEADALQRAREQSVGLATGPAADVTPPAPDPSTPSVSDITVTPAEADVPVTPANAAASGSAASGTGVSAATKAKDAPTTAPAATAPTGGHGDAATGEGQIAETGGAGVTPTGDQQIAPPVEAAGRTSDDDAPEAELRGPVVRSESA
ncbi:DivIVA domain-containing protein [Micromonospora sp. NPDC049903]|uniref:DivIVA domain-containing protein n=1 Tax=Micromonospora sp. NPDC049903 TaxID=3364276 RepID=UPI0037BC343D